MGNQLSKTFRVLLFQCVITIFIACSILHYDVMTYKILDEAGNIIRIGYLDTLFPGIVLIVISIISLLLAYYAEKYEVIKKK